MKLASTAFLVNGIKADSITGLDTAEMRAIGHKGYYDVAKDRDAVTEIFVNRDVKRTINKLGIKLISYADLRKKGVL
ncbi:MAG: hypothetical protein GY774_24050 [Planctomycetes bacterium]|nr:hypothetical protein [Planctomycetota bacterium]